MDRLTSEGYNTDKGANYLQYYESFFAPQRDRPVNLLELGVHMGGSLMMWRDYFEYGQIFGVDVNEPPLTDTTRIHTFVGDATLPDVFDLIEVQTGVGTFDIIIDDASHVGDKARASFEHLFADRLTPGGLYVIEDWGTGYMKTWPDGAAYKAPKAEAEQSRFGSHDAGMVGFVKSLVDHLARADVNHGGGSIEGHPIDFMTFAPGLVFIKKSMWA